MWLSPSSIHQPKNPCEKVLIRLPAKQSWSLRAALQDLMNQDWKPSGPPKESRSLFLWLKRAHFSKARPSRRTDFRSWGWTSYKKLLFEVTKPPTRELSMTRSLSSINQIALF